MRGVRRGTEKGGERMGELGTEDEARRGELEENWEKGGREDKKRGTGERR